MMVLQIDGAERSYLCVVIEPDNLARMEQGDPLTLNPVSIGGTVRPVQYPSALHVLIAYVTDTGRLYELIAARDNVALLEYLMRGMKFIRGDGKSARGPVGGA